MLELQERIKVILQIEAVYNEHPDWKKNSRISNSTNDHSSVASWIGKLDTTDLSKHIIKWIWHDGYDKSVKYLEKIGYSKAELTIKNTTVNILDPLDNPHDDGDNDDNEVFDQLHLQLHENDLEVVISDGIYCNRESVFEKTIEIDGCVVYKANAIANIIHSSSRLSKDRSLRVMGLSKDSFQITENCNAEFDDTLVVITDILATIASNKRDKCISVILFSIDKILIDSDRKDGITIENFNVASFHGVPLKLIEITEGNIIWKGDYADSMTDIPGYICCQVKSNVTRTETDELKLTIPLNEIDQIKMYLEQQVANIGFDKINFPKTSLVYESLNLTNHLNIEIKAQSTSNNFKCKICNQEFIKERMRQHIGKHILGKEILQTVNTCGFCGLSGCKIELKPTSGFGNYQTLGPHSDCQYFVHFSLKPASKVSKRSPCTNRPVICSHCKQCYWSYNLSLHYETSHPALQISDDWVPSSNEIKNVMSLKL